MEQVKKSKQEYAVRLLVLSVILIISILLLSNMYTPMKKENNEGVGPFSYDGRPHVLLIDQKVDGMVEILSASLKVNGYVVLYKEIGGGPGEITGVSNLLTAGRHSQFEVSHVAAVDSGSTVFALLHKDDGDGLFDAQKDIPMDGETGAIVLSSMQTL